MGSMMGKIGVEVPKHELLRAAGAGAAGVPYELRLYPACVVVETGTRGMVEGDDSFGKLAKYIGVFGTPMNEAGSKIAMTAPVITKPEVESSRVMQFILPSSITMATAPRPTDPSVRVYEMPRRTLAAMTFSGSCSEEVFRQKEAALLAALQADSIRVTGATQLHRYNPPWTPGPLKTNEVMVPVELLAYEGAPSGAAGVGAGGSG